MKKKARKIFTIIIISFIALMFVLPLFFGHGF